MTVHKAFALSLSLSRSHSLSLSLALSFSLSLSDYALSHKHYLADSALCVRDVRLCVCVCERERESHAIYISLQLMHSLRTYLEPLTTYSCIVCHRKRFNLDCLLICYSHCHKLYSTAFAPLGIWSFLFIYIRNITVDYAYETRNKNLALSEMSQNVVCMFPWYVL